MANDTTAKDLAFDLWQAAIDCDYEKFQQHVAAVLADREKRANAAPQDDQTLFECGKAAGRQEVKEAQESPDFWTWIRQAYREPESVSFTIHNMEVAYQAGVARDSGAAPQDERNLKGVPDRIYLVVGPHPGESFDSLEEVTWSHDPQFDTDIEYVRAALPAQAAAPVDEPESEPETLEEILEYERNRNPWILPGQDAEAIASRLKRGYANARDKGMSAEDALLAGVRLIQLCAEPALAAPVQAVAPSEVQTEKAAILAAARERGFIFAKEADGRMRMIRTPHAEAQAESSPYAGMDGTDVFPAPAAPQAVPVGWMHETQWSDGWSSPTFVRQADKPKPYLETVPHPEIVSEIFKGERFTPLYAAAQPAAQPADAQDAARYRFLAEKCRSTSEHCGGRWSIVIDGPAPATHDSEDDFDAAIDAARTQGEAP